ncbi:hypothetical protein KAR91_48835 [Candidatus Pacearchaeota archaeon]|nr:hypothetical protein [Candidatus Pacearchaeota archaeon]
MASKEKKKGSVKGETFNKVKTDEIKKEPLDEVLAPVKKRNPLKWVEVKPGRIESGEFAIVKGHAVKGHILYRSGRVIAICEKGLYEAKDKAEELNNE